MPSVVRELFAAARLAPEGVVPWGVVPPVSGSGVYVVALTDSVDSLDSALSAPPLDPAAFARWLEIVPGLTLDGTAAIPTKLIDRISRFWLPDEVVVYIGMATSLPSRVGDYFATPIGARRPHAGGYFLKLLKNLRDLYVHYARCERPAQAEDAMLGAFCRSVSDTARRSLLDPAHPFPFANLEWPRGTRKAHGLRAAREVRTPKAGVSVGPAAVPRAQPVALAAAVSAGPYRTQPVTGPDLAAGQVRIPTTTPNKSLFPADRGDLAVIVRGRRMDARWDPRTGPVRERSGVLRFRDKGGLRAAVRQGEVLRVALRGGNLWIE